MFAFAAAMALSAALAAAALGAKKDAPPGTPPASPPAKGAEYAALKPLIADGITALEKDIAGLILRRPDTPAAAKPRVDLAIDVRVVQRYLLVQAAKEEAEKQATFFLRANQLGTVIAGLEEQLKNVTGPMSRSQMEAMIRLRQISYSLGEAKASETSDDLCRNAAAAILNIASPAPVDPSTVPMMRPRKVDAPANETRPPKETKTPADEPKTLVSLTEDVRRANVAVVLRTQMMALADQAKSLSQEQGQDKEYAAVYQMLANSVDLVKGIQGTMGMDATTRAFLETQLAEGLALFSDPRTRDAGKGRIDSLKQYRQMVVMVSRSRLNNDQRLQFAAAFAWAQQNMDDGPRVLGALDQYADALTAFAELPSAPSSVPALRAATETLRKQFEAKRDAFIQTHGDVAAIGGVEPVEARVAEFKQILEILHLLNEMPQTLETLNAYKPKPFEGIERRVVTAAVACGNLQKPSAREDGLKLIKEITRLGRLGQLTAQACAAEVPTATAQDYTSGMLAPYQMKLRSMVTDIASSAAMGREIDKNKVAQILSGIDLLRALQNVAAMEATLSKTAHFERWVDWGLSIADFRAMLVPYRDAMIATFTSVSGGDPDALDRWKTTQSKYGPLVALAIRDAAYEDQCAALPTGFNGNVGRLLTPLLNQPFAQERFASFLITLCVKNNADREVIEAALQKRLGRDQKLNGADAGDPLAKPTNIRVTPANVNGNPTTGGSAPLPPPKGGDSIFKMD